MGKKCEAAEHYEATMELRRRADVFRVITERSGRHQNSKAVVAQFAAIVSVLEVSAREFERVYANEVDAAGSDDVREQLAEALRHMSNSRHLLEEASHAMYAASAESELLGWVAPA